MLRYTGQRIVGILLILFIIVSLSFFLLRAMPGDVFYDPLLPPDVQKVMEDKYHLNEPLPVQYMYFITDFIQGILEPH